MGQSYRDLVVWNKAMELVMEIYRLTQAFPKEEIFGLLSQFRETDYLNESDADGLMERSLKLTDIKWPDRFDEKTMISLPALTDNWLLATNYCYYV
jgi:hypothetical protein